MFQTSLLFLLLLFSYCSSVQQATVPTTTGIIAERPAADFSRIKAKALEARAFCSEKHFNTDYCFLADMSLHSGVKRFFIWDFKHDTIIRSFMVGHGCGNNPWSKDYSREKPVFSNTDGSHCSSAGKYKIGRRGYSSWGINVKYELHGLETTNNNAFARIIVLHGWEQMPDNEVYPRGSPEGWGCPTLSNNSMRVVDELLKQSKKPVLLWMLN